MLLGITICLVICGAYGSVQNVQYLQQSKIKYYGAWYNLTTYGSVDADEILYKPITTKETTASTKEQIKCLMIENSEKQVINYASLSAPNVYSKYSTKLKIRCNGKDKPKMWIGLNKHQDMKSNTNAPIVDYETRGSAILTLNALNDKIKVVLPGCDVCVENNADQSRIEVSMLPAEARNWKNIQSSDETNFEEPNTVEDVKIRRKRAVSSFLSTSFANKTVGDTFSVTCSGSSPNITWINPSGMRVKTASIADPRVKESVSKAKNTSELIFKDLSLAHAGTYKCSYAVNKTNNVESFYLSVLIKPKAKISTKKVTLNEGDDYTVTCSGNTKNVTWKSSNGLPISTHPGGVSVYYVTPDLNNNSSVLSFKNVSSWLGGDFHCLVESAGLQDKEKFTLTVKPTRLTFSPDDKDKVTVKENNDYDITCEGRLKWITWQINGVDVSSNKKSDIFMKESELKDGLLRRKLKFDDVQKNQGGKYVCWGVSSFNGSQIQRSFTLSVADDDSLSDPKLIYKEVKFTDSTVYLRVNESLEMECKGDTDQVEWKGPPHGWKIPEETSSSAIIQAVRTSKKKVALKFQKLAVRDEGTYTCQVTKKGKTTSKSFTLNVIDPVFFIGTQPSPSVNESAFLRLECKTGGHPKPMVNWYFKQNASEKFNTIMDRKNNSKYQFDGDTLLINNITYKESGKYVCRASQDIINGGTIDRATDVTVFHKPYAVKNHTILEKRLNSVVKFVCNMISNPQPYYAWYKYDNNNNTWGLLIPPAQSPALNVFFDDSSKFGEYKCIANNEFGSDQQFILAIPMEFPRAPEIAVTKTGEHFAYFTAKAQRNSSFTHYSVEFKEKDARDWSELKVSVGDNWDYLYEIPNLQPKTSYQMKVKSINELGVSLPSQEVTFTTSFALRLTISSTLIFAIILKWMI